ncbi:MAG TPA: amino acid ABC transporter permease [Treponema sp.]|nr:amino acid ABC transporter permease [Treponema sp.]
MRPFDPVYIAEYFCRLLPFVGRTLQVTVLSVVCGTLLGALLAWARLSRSRAARAVSAVYVHIIRCTPSIVLLFIVYYGLPKLIESATGIRAGYNGKLLYVAVTLSLLFAAAMCELFRAAYGAVDDGQRDAAFCCGFTPFQTAYLIIIPQALTAAIPVFCNEVIALLKQGALAFTIGFIDLMGETDVIVARNYGAHGLETYIALAVIYWGLSIIIERAAGIFERRAARGKDFPGRDVSGWN